MKKTFIISALAVLGLVLFSSNQASAQSESGQSVLSLHTGFSVTGGLIKAVFDSDIDMTDTSSGMTTGYLNSSVTGGPAIVAGWDLGLSERWSIGFIASTQGWSGDASYSYLDENNALVNENLTFNLRRNNVSFCPKIHYGNGDNVDLYSGIRIGYVFWSSSWETNDPDFDDFSNFNAGRPNIGLTAFGGRFYFNDNFGASFELNLGAPNILGLGLNYKL